MQYPNGKKVNHLSNFKSSYANRGMPLEEDINLTNKYYLDIGKAVIHKKPTPIQIVKVDYPKRSAAVIKEAYFKQASTTDYNGLYRGKYIDFEAKETKNKTRFPLLNIHEHQIKHMEAVVKHGGICFFILRFSILDETYLLEAEKLFPFWYDKLSGGKQSIPYERIKKDGYNIPYQYHKRVDYLSIVDSLYF